ncbi:TPR repeat family [Brachionus plicatilis]|uniref:TPR repeat family n=1 Tax=Brachionus plicatilis TaxID=10195 RepID=A0A3M7QBK7_BRAPC|nr:TPR repeat family [Brachionus plicatilis]
MSNAEKQNKIVLDVTNQDIDQNQLSNIYQNVRKQQYGDILWNEERFPKDQISIDLIEKIKQQLIDNNNEYSRFPSDLTLGKFSHYVYRTVIKKDDKADEIGPGWYVFDIFNEPDEDKSINEKKGSIYSGAIFVNDFKHQIVLAHRGINDDFKNLLIKDGKMVETIDGIWLKQIVPQLHICYYVTEEAHLLAEKKDYHLSFTGYSNGAWLAEHSIYYCNKYFKNNNTKAVLFESPGMVKNEDDEKPNIINHDTNFDFRDLNIVNYLTEPSFSNSINKHTGKTYRIFIEKKNYSLDFLDQLKKIPKIGNIIYDKIKKSNFFIEGLLSAMTYQRLDSILEQFDIKTGKPKYYEEMHQWPKIKLNFDVKYKENLKNFASKGVDELFSLIPLPGLIKKPSNIIMKWISSNALECLGKNKAQGIWLLLNFSIELINQNIDFKKFENPSFYKKLIDNYGNTDNGHNTENTNICQKFVNVELSYVPYKIENDMEQILRIGNESEKNIDWCLYHLQNINLEIGNIQSKLIIEQLEMLRKEYTIEIFKKKDFYFKDEILIKSVSNLRLEQIKERLARYLQIDPNLKNIIYNLTKSNLYLNSSLEICSNLDEELIAFVGRHDELNKMKEIFFEKNKQFLAICAHGGTGKSTLANFFGHIVKKDYKKFIIRWINSDSRSKIETQYRNLGDLLNITDKIVQFDFLVDRINGKLKIQNTNFLFIFDNLNNWNDIKDIASSLPKNVKILLTLRNSGIVEKIIGEENIINLNCFNQEEGVSFINKHLKYLDEEQKKQLITKIQFDGKIIPLQLSIIIRYFEENYAKEFSELIGKIFDSRDKNYLQLENNLFNELEKESLTTFNILIYCAYLDPDYIGLNILKLFVNDSMIENHVKTIQKYVTKQLENLKYCQNENIVLENIKSELLNKSANFYYYLEFNYKKALEYFQQCYELRKRLIGEIDHPDLDLSLSNIGRSYIKLGDIKKAMENFKKSYDMRKRLFGDIDHLVLAAALNNLGGSYSNLGD